MTRRSTSHRLALLIAGAAALATPLAAQTPPPMAVYSSFLDTSFFLEGPEVRIKESPLMLAFAPAGPFAATVRLRRGATVVHELPARVLNRAGSFATLGYRATGVGLGPEEGERTLELVVDGAVVGQFTFTVRKRSVGDAFDPTVSWEVDGPWRTHAFLQYDPQGAQPQRIFVHVWLSTIELPGGQRGAVEVRGRRGGRTLFTAFRTQVSARGFQGATVEAVMDARRTPWSGERLAGQEGPLTVELVHDGRVVRAFETRIVHGTFAAHPQSALTPPDPLHFLSPRVLGDRGVVNAAHRFWMTR